MNRCYRFTYLIILHFSIPVWLYAQDDILHKYIKEGIENNLSLGMKLDDYNKSIQALNAAKGLFYPDISFNTRYTRAEGGRIISFPAGDLLNPVYSALNQLTMSNIFPEIENQEFAFLRPKEHETKFRLVQPIVNTDLFYNMKIRESMIQVEKANMETYRRALVADIKKAYYNHLKALNIKQILVNSNMLLEENIRVTRSLFENDKVTRDAVYRSEAELNRLMQHIAEADKAVMTSKAWFNFLLNRELSLPVEIEEPEDPVIMSDYDDIISDAVTRREEMIMMEAVYDAGFNRLKMQKAHHLPELVAVLDYGFQGTKYRFTGEDDFAMASFVLRWDLFKGSVKRYEIRQAQINLNKINKQIEAIEKSVEIQILTAYYDLQAAGKKIPAAKSELYTTAEAFRMIEKKYSQGQVNLVEFIDARTSKTNAEIGQAIARYEFLNAWVEFERVTAIYDFN